ncbi:CDP-2,3-bis-(O-geranylgeranyl)-sn-glycerol synthase [Candidatus Micrarchaeota archaeon]|nr:CDP-2,3-bis-(O-geranylgeranyl)-sn-glycerol synthase [Candidatus Micrarchaeota archaeon]MBI5177520.1 CDP-2,3-bis-(O-geranylgeranyl)-sn-glycerol synthase [Candidatus Micrarchaeota archaeon]
MGILETVLFILPAYVANMAPVLSRGRTAVDLETKFVDDRRLFGEGKTFRGILAALIAGTAVALALSYTPWYLPGFSLNSKLLAGVLLSCGAMAGDLLGSFLKRRLGIKRGEKHRFFDQLLFLGGALALASPVFLPGVFDIALLVALTYFLHRATNVIAYWLKLKPVPW